jgi:glycine/D-amino acid oxidase-like deaminating enzyme
MTQTHEAVICGAGMAGVSAAYFLCKAGMRDILLVDERPPLSFTSDRSTECYRNWWPDPEMLALMNCSIDLMEQLADESGNVFHLNRRGYLYITGDENKLPGLRTRSQKISELGGGELRIHSAAQSCYQPAAAEGFHDQPGGADMLIGQDLIHKHFPYLTDKAAAALHARRAGWLSAQQLGMYLLEQARAEGVKFTSARVEAVELSGGHVRGVRLSSGQQVDAPVFINAAGPYFKEVGKMLGVDLPVETELHLKVVMKDALGVVGRDAPLLIWDDTQLLPWSSEERAGLQAEAETAWLTERFPAGAHTRPEGGRDSQNIILLWEYRTKVMEPAWPPPLDEIYPEIALRGMATMLPGLEQYFAHIPRPQLDGGYYTHTPENRLLAGPLEIEGAYVIGALSGYGIMAGCGAGDLLSRHITGQTLPSYAPDFTLERYKDPIYQEKLKALDGTGQL